MAVHSTEVLIDPVGACVGQRGDRVTRVVDELRGEKIDIIKWSENPAEFIANALNPANVREVYTEASGQRSCIVVVRTISCLWPSARKVRMRVWRQN